MSEEGYLTVPALTEQLSNSVYPSSTCQCDEKIRIWKKESEKKISDSSNQ